MAVVCHYCNEPASSSDLPCSSCKSFYHHVCLFPASIISTSWTHINSPPPSYALAIFSSPNFTFTCPSCLLNNSSNTSTTFSSPLVTPTPIHRNNPPIRPPIPAQLRIPKLMELKTFPPSFITANIPSPFPYHLMHLLLYHLPLLSLLKLLSSTMYLLILPHPILFIYLVNVN